MKILETEPVVSSAVIVSLVSAILVLAISFGFQISEAQRDAILGLTAILAPFGVVWWSKHRTTSLADPKVTTEDGTVTPLIRADTGRATPQAIKHGNVV